MTDEEMAEAYTSEHGFGSDCNNIDSVDANREMVKAYLAGLKVGRQQQSGIGWIDTAHIEIKLHDAVENIKKQLDVLLQEVLGGNNV